MKIQTRLTEKSPKVETDLSVDWSGTTDAELKEWALRTVVISYQRVVRDAGKIPTKDHIKVHDFMAGKGRPERQVTPEKFLAQADSLTPEKIAETMAALEKIAAAKKAAGKK
jgi:hypothetical protein